MGGSTEGEIMTTTTTPTNKKQDDDEYLAKSESQMETKTNGVELKKEDESSLESKGTKSVKSVKSKSEKKKVLGETASFRRAPLNFWNPRSARFQFSMLLFLVSFSYAIQRNSISMAIVCMVNSTHFAVENNSSSSNIDPECPDLAPDTEYEGSLLWSSSEKGLIMSSVDWSGVLVAIPSGYLAERFSPKSIITICLGVTTFGCLLTPVASQYGNVVGIVILRVLMGFFGQAMISPTISAMTTRWIPPGDRTSCVALYTSGVQIGMISAGPLNAFLCRQTHFLDGWPSIYYVSGAFAIPILVIWLICAADIPRKYRWIRKDELDYIKDSLSEQHLKKKIKCSDIPWKGMMTSLPFLVNLIGTFAMTIMAATIQKYLPTYFKQALKMDLKKNGLYSALPFVFQFLGKMIAAPIIDRLRMRKTCSPTTLCKIANSLGAFLSAIFLIATGYTTCKTTTAAVSFMAVSSFFYSFLMAGFVTSLISIAPAYTSIVNAVSRLVGQVAALSTPLLIGMMTTKETSDEWRSVFWMVSGVMIGFGILFLIFGSAEIQPWAKRADGDQDSEGSSSDNPIEV